MGPFALFLLALSGVAAWSAFKMWQRTLVARDSRTWGSVRGVVESSEVVERRDGGRGAVLVPSIRFRFDSRGRTHRGETITHGSALYTSFPQRAEAKCREYPVGAEVRVYFDPERPELACLEPFVGNELAGHAASVLFAVLSLGSAVGAVVMLLA